MDNLFFSYYKVDEKYNDANVSKTGNGNDNTSIGKDHQFRQDSSDAMSDIRNEMEQLTAVDVLGMEFEIVEVAEAWYFNYAKVI